MTADQRGTAVPARPRVLAVLVARGLSGWLPETLRSLAASSQHPDRLLVVLWGGRDHEEVRRALTEAGLTNADVVTVSGAATFGHAVRLGLAHFPPVAGEWLWLLHDDSAPEPEALAAHLRTVANAPSVVLAGAKQTEWERPDELISVGVGQTRSGRRFTALEEGEIDQGQHDGRADVIAVGTAGALVRRDVWEDLRGTDPSLGPFGDGADLARRARLAGHRVVVVPGAVVRHARAGYHGQRRAPHGGGPEVTARPLASWSARREALLYSRLAASSLPVACLAFVWMFLAAPLRILLALMAKDFATIPGELRAPFAVAARLPAIARARSQARSTRTLARRVLRPLQTGWGTRLAAWRDRRLARAAARRSARTRSELEIAEAASLARRRRWALAAVLLLAVALTALTTARLAFAGPLVGGALLPVDGDLSEVWTQVTSPWLLVGDGHAEAAPPFLGLLAAGTAVLGGWWGTPVSTTIAVILVGALPLAALGAWFAAGAATRRIGVRVWAALVWMLAPSLLLALAQGRIGAVVAHLALPWVALAVARALGVHRRDVIRSGLLDAPDHAPEEEAARRRPPQASPGAAAGGALALALACLGAPILLPIALVALAVIALTLPRLGALTRGRATSLLLVPLPSLVLIGPWLATAFADAEGPAADAVDTVVRMLLAGPGQAYAIETPQAWQMLLGWPDLAALTSTSAVPSWLPIVLIGAPVLIGAVLALLARGGLAGGVRTLWTVALAVLALAAVVARLQVATSPVLESGDDAQQVQEQLSAAAWVGPALSVVLLGLLGAAALGSSGLPRLREHAWGWRHLTAGALVTGALIAPVSAGLAWVGGIAASDLLVVAGRGADPVPALGRQLQQSVAAARVVALTPTAQGTVVEIWRGDGPQLLDAATAATSLSGSLRAPIAAVPDAAQEDLARAVALLESSSDDAAAALVDHAVGLVIVPPVDSTVSPGGDAAARARLVAALNATAELELVTTNDAGTIYRVLDSGGAARLRVTAPDGHTPAEGVVTQHRDLPEGALVSGQLRAGGEVTAVETDRLLVLAERADARWRVSLDGRALEATEIDWRAAFLLPAGAEGEVELSFHDPARTAWAVAQIVVVGVVVLLAVPMRRRDVEEDS